MFALTGLGHSTRGADRAASGELRHANVFRRRTFAFRERPASTHSPADRPHYALDQCWSDHDHDHERLGDS
jgi:hypothetical protein